MFRTAAEISGEIDSDAARDPELPLDLMSSSDVRGLVKQLPHGAIVMLLNRGDSAAQVRISDLRLGGGDTIALDLSGGDSAVFDEITLPPHSARIIRAY